MRAQKIHAVTFSSRPKTSERRTTNGAKIVVGTTEDGPNTDVPGFEKSEQPTC